MRLPSPGRSAWCASVTRPWAAPVVAALLLGTSSAAQSNAGSTDTVSVAHGATSSGGVAQSANFALKSGVGQVSTGAASLSTNFQFRGGVTWVPPQITTDAPIVFGVRGGLGEATGAEPVEVLGYNFAQTGAGSNAIAFDGVVAGSTTTLSNTQLSTVTPMGVDANGNPLAFAAVSVSNNLGSDTAANAFVFQPALTSPDFTHVGGAYDLQLYSRPGSFAFVFFGESIPGTAIPISPYRGSLEAIVGLEIVTPLLGLPTGLLELNAPVFDNPSLIGATLELQTLTLDDATLSTGSFSNLLAITLQS